MTAVLDMTWTVPWIPDGYVLGRANELAADGFLRISRVYTYIYMYIYNTYNTHTYIYIYVYIYIYNMICNCVHRFKKV